MTLLIDAAPIVALADPAEPEREAILDALTEETGALVIPAPTTAEIEYLLGQRFGPRARRAFLADLATGRFSVGNLERADYANERHFRTVAPLHGKTFTLVPADA